MLIVLNILIIGLKIVCSSNFSALLLTPWRLWGFWTVDQTKSVIWSCIGCFWILNKLTIKWKYLANSPIMKRTISCSPSGGMLLTATNITFCCSCKTFKDPGNNHIFLHLFFRPTQTWTEADLQKRTKKYWLKNLIKEQHKRELKIPGNYCQPELLWNLNHLISPQSHRIINYTARNNKTSFKIRKIHINYSPIETRAGVWVFSGCYTTVLKACSIMLVWWVSWLALTNTFITFPSLK